MFVAARLAESGTLIAVYRSGRILRTARTLGVRADYEELTERFWPDSPSARGQIEVEIRFAFPAARDRLELTRVLGGGRSSPRHQDLREGSASEALLFDDFKLQVLI